MNFRKVKNYIDEVIIKEKRIPSLDLMVIKGNELLYSYKAGFCDYERKIPLHKDALYYMYSCTKPLTVALAMRLYEEGKLDLEEKVETYLPAYKNIYLLKGGEKIKPEKELKVKHLFTMSGGFTYDWTNPAIKEYVSENPSASTVEIANLFASFPLIFEPGQRFEYSLCHDILAAVVESIAKKPFREYAKEALFEPVGMNNSFFHIDESLKPRLAAKYNCIKDDEGFKIVPIENINYMILGENYDSGGAGLICTLEDYAKFAKVLANGGICENGYRFLKEETVELIKKDWLKEICENPGFGCTCGDAGYSYGLGVRVKTAENGTSIPVGEFGWDGACGSYISVDTKEKTAIVIGMHVLSWNLSIQNERNKLCELICEALS